MRHSRNTSNSLRTPRLPLTSDSPRQPRFFVLRDLQRIVRAADEPLGTICFLLAVNRNADRRGARAPKAGLGLSSQADKGPLFHLRRANWDAKEQGEHCRFADAARARIASQEIPSVASLS